MEQTTITAGDAWIWMQALECEGIDQCANETCPIHRLYTLAEARASKKLWQRLNIAKLYCSNMPTSFRLCQLTPNEQRRYINNHSKSLLTLRLIYQKTDAPLSWLAPETFNRVEQRVIENEIKQNNQMLLELE